MASFFALPYLKMSDLNIIVISLLCEFIASLIIDIYFFNFVSVIFSTCSHIVAFINGYPHVGIASENECYSCKIGAGNRFYSILTFFPWERIIFFRWNICEKGWLLEFEHFFLVFIAHGLICKCRNYRFRLCLHQEKDRLFVFLWIYVVLDWSVVKMAKSFS